MCTPAPSMVYPPPHGIIPLSWSEGVREKELEREETTGQTGLTDNDAVFVHGCRAWRAGKAHNVSSKNQ